MNLVATYPIIEKNPCYTCVQHESGQSIDCVSFCWPVNKYLISIGEKPHTHNDVKLYIVHPQNTRKIPKNKTSHDEFLQACEKIRAILKQDKKLSQTRLAALIGIPQPIISSLNRYGATKQQHRQAQRSMSREYFKVIMEFKIYEKA